MPWRAHPIPPRSRRPAARAADQLDRSVAPTASGSSTPSARWSAARTAPACGSCRSAAAGRGGSRTARGRDTAPRFSPDGRTLAFTLQPREGRDRPGAGCCRWTAATPQPLTDVQARRHRGEWMPDGRVAGGGRRRRRLARCCTASAKGRRAATARVLRRVDWRMDGDGLLDHRRHVHLVPLARPRPAADQGPVVGAPRAPASRRQIDRLPGRPRRRRDSIPIRSCTWSSVTSGRIRLRSKLPGRGAALLVRPGRHADLRRVRPQPAHGRGPQRWYGGVAGDGSGRLLTEGIERFAGKQGTGDERLTVIHDARPRRALPGHRRRAGGRWSTPTLNPTAYELAGGRRAGGGADDAGRLRRSRRVRAGAGARAAAADVGRRRLAARGRARPEVQELIVKGPAGPIRTFVLSPPGARQPAAADHPAHPRRPDLGLAVRGRRHRSHAGRRRLPGGATEHPRIVGPAAREWIAAAGRGLGRRGRRRLPRRARPPGQGRAGGPQAAGLLRQQLRRVHGQLAGRHQRPVRRGGLVERRHQPDLGLRRTATSAYIYNPPGGPGRAAHAGGRRVALAAVAAAARVERAHAADDPAGRERPALPAGRQRAVLHRAARGWAARSSTCCTPRATTRWPRAPGPTAASTAWSGSWRGSGSTCSECRFCIDLSRVCAQPRTRTESGSEPRSERSGSTSHPPVTAPVTLVTVVSRSAHEGRVGL